MRLSDKYSDRAASSYDAEFYDLAEGLFVAMERYKARRVGDPSLPELNVTDIEKGGNNELVVSVYSPQRGPLDASAQIILRAPENRKNSNDILFARLDHIADGPGASSQHDTTVLRGHYVINESLLDRLNLDEGTPQQTLVSNPSAQAA